MKKIVFLCLLVCLFFSKVTLAADCARSTSTFSDGDILYATDLESEFNNLVSCVNERIQGTNNTFSSTVTASGGDIKIQSGYDLKMYSDSGTTLTGQLDGATGKLIGGVAIVGNPINLNITNATTSVANDSIKIECGNSACSATNPGFIHLPSTTAGDFTLFKIASDVTIPLTGAHWGQGTYGDLTDAILRVSAVNAAGSLVWCVNYQGGRKVLTSSLDSTTATDINLPEELLCNAAVSADAHMIDSVFWFKANFDDTGGSSEDLWAVQTGVGDLNFGSADGQKQIFNTSVTGITSQPTTIKYFTQIGDEVCVSYFNDADSTSNSTSKSLILPIAASVRSIGTLGLVRDNGAWKTAQGGYDISAGSRTLNLYINGDLGTTTWTSSGSWRVAFYMCYFAN